MPCPSAGRVEGREGVSNPVWQFRDRNRKGSIEDIAQIFRSDYWRRRNCFLDRAPSRGVANFSVGLCERQETPERSRSRPYNGVNPLMGDEQVCQRTNQNQPPRPASPSPAWTLHGEDLLAKYKPLGEDHPSYRKLKEALVRGQSAGVAEAVAELEAVRKVTASLAAVATKPKAPRLLLWIFLWGICLAAALCALAQQYFSAHLQEIIARHSPESSVEIIPGEAIGGQKSAEITARLLKEVDDLKPDNCLFVGHQLAKKEIVEYFFVQLVRAFHGVMLLPARGGSCLFARERKAVSHNRNFQRNPDIGSTPRCVP